MTPVLPHRLRLLSLYLSVMPYCHSTTTHQSKLADSLSVQAPSTARPIHDLRTYELFEGLPTLPSLFATTQQWSTDARFYQGSALDATRLPPSHDRDENIGSIPYIALPKTSHSAEASIQLKVDRYGIPFLDPVIERTRTSKHQELKTPRPSKKSSKISLLGTCDSFGIVGDPRGHEKLAAFGRVPRIESFEDEEEDEWWTPDWAIVSGVLPGGTVRRVLEGCSRSNIPTNGTSNE
jgi:hypothetical protein